MTVQSAHITRKKNAYIIMTAKRHAITATITKRNNRTPAGSRLAGVRLCCTNVTQPTGNLDTQNSSEVIALLKEASKKYEQTIVMITHNNSIAQAADRVLNVSDGVLTDLGRCRE